MAQVSNCSATSDYHFVQIRLSLLKNCVEAAIAIAFWFIEAIPKLGYFVAFRAVFESYFASLAIALPRDNGQFWSSEGASDQRRSWTSRLRFFHSRISLLGLAGLGFGVCDRDLPIPV